MNRMTSLRLALLVLPLPVLPGCGALGSAAGRVGLLVLLPLVFVALFIWALRYQRRKPLEKIEDVDERRYPDYRGDDDGR